MGVLLTQSLLSARLQAYGIDFAALFNGTTSKLEFTPMIAGDRKTWHASAWIALTEVHTTGKTIFSAFQDASNFVTCYLDYQGGITLQGKVGGTNVLLIESEEKIRDLGSFGFVEWAVDTTAATPNADECWIKWNGVKLTDSNAVYPPQDTELQMHNTVLHTIGSHNGGQFTACYVADARLISGFQPDTSAFTKTDAKTKNLIPASYKGRYAPNGFVGAAGFFDFSNADDLGVGGATVAGDVYATWNPLESSGGTTYTNDHLTASLNADGENARTSLAIPSGVPMYAEFGVDAVNGSALYFGVSDRTYDMGKYPSQSGNQGFWGWGSHGYYIEDGTQDGGGHATFTTSDRLAVARNDTQIWLGKVSGGSVAWEGGGNPATGTLPTITLPVSGMDAFLHMSTTAGTNTEAGTLYTKETEWNADSPTGFVPLSVNSLPVQSERISEHFNTVLYTGDGTSTQAVSGVGFQPDVVWIKARSSATWHTLYDSLRGGAKYLYPNYKNVESDTSGAPRKHIDSFDSDGWTFNAGDGSSEPNVSGTSYVAWCASLPSSQTNTSGDISVDWIYNASLGMAVGTYTGDGTAGHTLGLPTINGSAPKMAMVKGRDYINDWCVYHADLTGTDVMYLDLTNASVANATMWNNTDPTETLFTLGNSTATNKSGNSHVIYCFWETDFCKVGSYTGNGSSDGPFLNLAGEATWAMHKRADSVEDWIIWDGVRSPYNPRTDYLKANSPDAEITGDSTRAWDETVNGRKCRTSHNSSNLSGGTYVYLAFLDPVQTTMKVAGDWEATDAVQVTSSPTHQPIRFNPLHNQQGGGTVSNGGKSYTGPSTRTLCGTTVLPPAKGKWVWVMKASAITNAQYQVGFASYNQADFNDGVGSNEDLKRFFVYSQATNYRVDEYLSSGFAFGSPDTADELWWAIDYDAGKLWFGLYDDGASSMTWYDSAGTTTGDPASGSNPTFTFAVNEALMPAVGATSGCVLSIQDEGDVLGTLPTGFQFITTDNLPKQSGSISDHFNTLLYTGDGVPIGTGGRSISGMGFDCSAGCFLWFKQRDRNDNHVVYSTLLGSGTATALYTNTTSSITGTSEGLVSYDGDGFTLGSWNNINNSGTEHVAWGWPLPSSETNTSGDISVEWIYNASLGMAVGTYTGSGTNLDQIHFPTINGNEPGMVVFKRLDATWNWIVYHKDLGSGGGAGDYYVLLESTSAQDNTNMNSIWPSGGPSATGFALGTDGGVNASGGEYLVIAFWETDFCKVGSYEGNSAADGPFINMGGQPVWMLDKHVDGAGHWCIRDAVRNSSNPANRLLLANDINAEFGYPSGTYSPIDFLANGAKNRCDSNVNYSNDTGTHIYLAFVQPNGPTENPAR